KLKVKTPIKRVTIKGGIVEVEFEGEPNEQELKIIAAKLRKKKFLRVRDEIAEEIKQEDQDKGTLQN
ncbi:hypothetical protein J7L00_01460, partial [Candidatus Bathyarchaeota archaeon]|nr:hypothetical protein [Candidatus Bathyarchaeota archaeon]